MADKSVEAKQEMDEFFTMLISLSEDYKKWVGKYPNSLVINPDIVGKLSRVEGFYQRQELGTEVSLHAPLIRFFKLKDIVVLLIEDYDEQFLHFDE